MSRPAETNDTSENVQPPNAETIETASTPRDSFNKALDTLEHGIALRRNFRLLFSNGIEFALRPPARNKVPRCRSPVPPAHCRRQVGGRILLSPRMDYAAATVVGFCTATLIAGIVEVLLSRRGSEMETTQGARKLPTRRLSLLAG
jgi:hypothetical protein